MSEAGKAILEGLDEALQWVRAMSPEDRERMWEMQRAGMVKAQAEAPRPRYEWVNGVKVYASYSDYCEG